MRKMRKTVAAVLALILCLCLSAAALAEFDLSGLSVDDLNELITQAQKEIFDKGGDVVIPGGKYVVGMDIAPGSYDMKFADESLMTAAYLIRDVEGNVIENESMAYESWAHLTLKDGQKLELQTSCYVRKGTRLGF